MLLYFEICDWVPLLGFRGAKWWTALLKKRLGTLATPQTMIRRFGTAVFTIFGNRIHAVGQVSINAFSFRLFMKQGEEIQWMLTLRKRLNQRNSTEVSLMEA
jgi:hypothetical protein